MSRGEKYSKRSSAVSEIILAAVLLLLIAAFIVIFRTEGIAVTGNVHMSADSVAEKLEDQPFSFNTVLSLAWNKVFPITNEGFIETVDISLAGQQTLRAEVHERIFAGYIFQDGRNLFFDRHGVICAESIAAEPSSGPSYMIRLDGVAVKNAQIGDSMPLSDKGIYEQIGNMRAIFVKDNFYPDRVIMHEDGTVSIRTGKIEVLLGDLSHLDLRLQRLLVLLPELENKKGVLHLETYDGTSDTISFNRE